MTRTLVLDSVRREPPANDSQSPGGSARPAYFLPYRMKLHFVLAMLLVVILVAYVPQVSLFVPNLVFGK